MRGRSLRKLFGFIALPMLSAISPLIALPAITLHFGAIAWASVAVAQSIGAAAAVIVELGWGLNGPQRVARASEPNQRQMLATALATKMTVFALVGVVATVTAVLLSPSYSVTAALVAGGAAGVGLTSTWYFIGTGSPGRIMVTDSIPRIVAVCVAALIISIGAPLFVYGLATLLPSLLSPVLSVWVTGVRRQDFRIARGGRLFLAIRLQMLALSGRAISALYIALPITLVSLVSPQAVAVFASVERLQRMSLTLLQSIPNFMQGWVGRSPDHQVRMARALQSILINGCLGLLAGVGFTVLAPWVSDFLFSGVVDVPIGLSAFGGCLIFIVCLSRATGNITLVALRKLRVISISALAGALVGVPSILVFAALLGPAGGLLGEVIAEAVVLSVQLIGVRRALGRNGRS